MTDPDLQLTPEEEDFYAKSSITVVFDIFADTATRIGGKYVHLADHAATEEERRHWKAKIYEVRDQRRAADPDDREALVAHIKRWQAEVARLKDR
ncbi:hypothetical protein HDA32_005606 [Spinactinospora alkalitolerans]|uniref:Uncharacterized protein n=1 Tax=Spinactinospora alkalitolerans TaxID=687207 RepID=A0A852U0W4_9ACTN|nr:hypothetical protein [Spinactinospora alkalitolerans]NYE50486.1 hypothetical protein [Spinactinospora alkalitolerans]